MILKEIPSSAIAEPENPTLMENLKKDQCKFPLGEINDPPKYFCGKPLAYSNGWLYCKEHLKLCTNEKKT